VEVLSARAVEPLTLSPIRATATTITRRIFSLFFMAFLLSQVGTAADIVVC
jgi:hypothetical protein